MVGIMSLTLLAGELMLNQPSLHTALEKWPNLCHRVGALSECGSPQSAGDPGDGVP